MPAISGVSSTNLAALNRVLVQVGKGMDADSPAAQKLDDTEAQKVIGELNNLDPASKSEVTNALAALMRDEFIQVTDTGRAAFADAMGVNVAALTPKQTAELAGLTAARTAFAASMQALSKTPMMKGARMKAIVNGLKEFVPPEGQKMMAAILNQASADGVLKMDTNARKEFRKFVGSLDKSGDPKDARDASDAKRPDAAAGTAAPASDAAAAQTEHPVTVASAKEGLNADRTDHGVTSFQRALAKGGFFEDILAAFMFDLIQEIQGEVLDKAGEFDRDKSIRGDSDRQTQQAQSQGAQGQNVADLIKKEARKENPQVSDAELDARVDQAQSALEKVVNSVGAHKNDDGKIDPEEAVRIAGKLGELDAPVNHLVADAMLRAIGHTDMHVGAAAVKPIVDWAVKTITEATGQEPDLTSVITNPNVAKGGDDDPVIQGLANSDRLENKIAAFMLQAFVGDKVEVGDKVKQLRKAKQEWGDAARHCDKLINPEGQRANMEAAAPEQAQTQAADGAGGAGSPPGTDATAQAAHPEGQPPGAQQAAGNKPMQPTGKQATEMKTQSRQELMEELKTLQQELQQALQALSNILNMMHQNSMNSIRSIR